MNKDRKPDADDDFVKVHVDLPNHWHSGGESMWARLVGPGLFELHNVPFFAYGLNFLDVVEARAPATTEVLEIVRLVKPSGYRTIRVMFDKSVEPERRKELLNTLKEHGASFENADSTLFAISVRPDGDYLAILDALDVWANQDVLGLETCEERVDGSFDDSPDDEAG